MSQTTLPPEQGATRSLRPSDFQRPGAPNLDKRRTRREVRRERPAPYEKRKPGTPGTPGYRPRIPRAPKDWPGGLPPKPNGLPRRPATPYPKVPAPALARGAARGAGAALRLGRFIVPRLLGPAGLILPLIPLVVNNPNKMWRPNPANGWRKCWGDCLITPNHSSNSISSCTTPSQMCLSGQAIPGGGVPNGIAPPLATDTKFCLSFGVFVTILGVWRHQLHSFYSRTVTTTNISPALVPATDPVIFLSPAGDPNILRWAPSLKPGTDGNPYRWNVPEPKIEIGVGEVMDRMDALADQSFEVASPARPPARRIIGFPPGMAPVGPMPDQATRDPEPPKPARSKPPHVRRKPPKHERQRKVRGPVYLFFAIADSVSEGSEVVDALFEALPDDVQKRWYRDRKISGADKYRHPLIDQAGQYGIDGADWKMQAVFHNFHKIDIEEAIKNIVANQIEDKLIGSLHRNLPANFINANEDGQKAYAKLVSKLLVELGLKEPQDEKE